MATLTYGSVDNWIEFMFKARDYMNDENPPIKSREDAVKVMAVLAQIAKDMGFSLTVGDRAYHFEHFTRLLSEDLHGFVYQLNRQAWLNPGPEKRYYLRYKVREDSNWLYVRWGDTYGTSIVIAEYGAEPGTVASWRTRSQPAYYAKYIDINAYATQVTTRPPLEESK